MKRRLAPSLAMLLQSFLREHLVATRRASPQTIAAYRDALRLLIVFAAERHGTTPSGLLLEQLDRKTLLDFLKHLETERENTARTRNARLAAIKAFFRHIAFLDPGSLAQVEQILSVPGKRTTKAAITYLSRDELDAVLAAPDRETAIGRRWYALLLFLARTGARVSEAIRVSAADLCLAEPRQVRLFGKGAKERIVPLDRDLARVLRSRETGRPDQLGMPIFTSATGVRLSRHGAIYMIRRAVVVAAKKYPALLHKRVSPHTFRHTLAMHLLQAGVDLIVIQAWLGHASVVTTHAYVEADMEMKRRALAKAGITEQPRRRYRPTDAVLQVLEAL
ncbi:MAG: tyrosine-type recombinase/integrase [Deltaproteobacteria bacterium]|nr:tyrosine-type recombinase/integrase [Deltaproteobacteria bacterium]